METFDNRELQYERAKNKVKEIKARKESVKGHKFENGLLNRYNKMDELFKDNKDIQLANQGKSSKTKG